MSKITIDLDTWKEVLTSDAGWKKLQAHLLNDVLEAQMISIRVLRAAGGATSARRIVTGTVAVI